MYRKLLISLVFSCLMVNVVNSIVCMPGMCAAVSCLAVENCDGPNQEIRPGGFCSCCNVCYTILGENESCSDLLYIMGGPSPPTSGCGRGLVCSKGKCTRLGSLDSSSDESD